MAWKYWFSVFQSQFGSSRNIYLLFNKTSTNPSFLSTEDHSDDHSSWSWIAIMAINVILNICITALIGHRKQWLSKFAGASILSDACDTKAYIFISTWKINHVCKTPWKVLLLYSHIGAFLTCRKYFRKRVSSRQQSDQIQLCGTILCSETGMKNNKNL